MSVQVKHVDILIRYARKNLLGKNILPRKCSYAPEEFYRTVRQLRPIGQLLFVLYKQSNFIGFEETSSYWSPQFSLFSIGHHLGSNFTGTNRNGPNCRIEPDYAYPQ